MNTAINTEDYEYFNATEMVKLSYEEMKKQNEERKIQIDRLIHDIYKEIVKTAKNGKTKLRYTSYYKLELKKVEVQEIKNFLVNKGFKVSSENTFVMMNTYTHFSISWEESKEEIHRRNNEEWQKEFSKLFEESVMKILESRGVLTPVSAPVNT